MTATARVCLLLPALWAGALFDGIADSELETGTVKGIVSVRAKDGADMGRQAGAYADRRLRRAARFDYRRPGAVVVYLERIGAGRAGLSDEGTQSTEPATIHLIRKGGALRLQPQELVVTRGASVRFLNRDRAAHILFSNAPGNAFEFYLKPGDGASPVVMSQPGVVDVYAMDVEALGGRIVVAGEYFVVVARPGAFVIEGVAPGTYTVNGWHPRLPSEEKRVTIRAGETVDVDIGLGVNFLPKIEQDAGISKED